MSVFVCVSAQLGVLATLGLCYSFVAVVSIIRLSRSHVVIERLCSNDVARTAYPCPH